MSQKCICALSSDSMATSLRWTFQYTSNVCLSLYVHPWNRVLTVVYAAGQNKGKAALEYDDTTAAEKAVAHMNNGQLDGAVLSVSLSDLPIRKRSRSRSPIPPPRGPPPPRGYGPRGRDRPRSFSRSRSRSRSHFAPEPFIPHPLLVVHDGRTVAIPRSPIHIVSLIFRAGERVW